MNIQKGGYRKSILLGCLLLSNFCMITIACSGGAALVDSGNTRSDSRTVAALPEMTYTPIFPTPTSAVIPVTALEGLEITACPDWDVNKMYEYGEYEYGRYCAGCHGRQGQGVSFANHFPPLNTSALAVSEDISNSLFYMMNTDIHHNASLLFEKDALAVINYIRITFASNTDIICPGEYVIEINP